MLEQGYLLFKLVFSLKIDSVPLLISTDKIKFALVLH